MVSTKKKELIIKFLLETGDWYSYDHAKIPVEKDWNIHQAESKLYGGQQFERLLAEFKAVVERRE